MKKKVDISKSDKKTWEEFIKNPKSIFDKENPNREDLTYKRYKYDLHGFTLEEANKKVREIISYCVEKKFKELLIITGKGLHSDTDRDVYASKKLSTLRHSIPDFITNNSDLSSKVKSFATAPQELGGEGAILIKLKIL